MRSLGHLHTLRGLALGLTLGVLSWSSLGVAAASGGGAVVDRVVVKFTASEVGGQATPQFVFERELAFESRLEALTDSSFVPTAELPFRSTHVQSALERHIAETLLENLPISPPPSAADMARRTEEVRLAILQQVGGLQALQNSQLAESIATSELTRMLRRRARASLYLDRMVAPMLSPSRAELQSVHRSGRTPFSKEPFPDIINALRRWYISQALKDALLAFYEDARSRVKVTLFEASR